MYVSTLQALSLFLIRFKSKGKAEPSFVSKYLSDLSESDSDIADQEEHIEEIKNAAAQIFSAGADSVST